MIELIGIMALLALVAVRCGVTLFAGPGGVLPSLMPRRWRYRYRHWAGDRAEQKSGRIPERMRERCFRADRHRCVYCGSRARLQADHVIPWIMGGPTVLWNLVTLCEPHNSLKSCYWVSPSGKVYYRGRRQPPPECAAIYARECQVRRNPLRLLRALI